MGTPRYPVRRLGQLAVLTAGLVCCYSVSDSGPLAKQLNTQFRQRIAVSFDGHRKGLILILATPPDSTPDAAEQIAMFARMHYAHPALVKTVTVIIEPPSPSPAPSGDSAVDTVSSRPTTYSWTAAQLAADAAPARSGPTPHVISRHPD
jgi:hypothetical protein